MTNKEPRLSRDSAGPVMAVYYLSFLLVLLCAMAMSILRSEVLFAYDSLLNVRLYPAVSRWWFAIGQGFILAGLPFLFWAVLRSYRPGADSREVVLNLALGTFVSLLLLVWSVLALALPWAHVVVGMP